MNKKGFQELFTSMLERAAADVEKRFALKVSREFVIELYGLGHSGSEETPSTAIEKVFISSDKYYRIIDLAVRRCLKKQTVIFVRVSDHPPSSYEDTWSPESFGPFKILEADCAQLGMNAR